MTTEPHAPQSRPTTDIDRIANDYLDALVELSPIAATYLGIAGHDEDLDDFSPAGYSAQCDLRHKTLGALAQATAVDDIDRVTLTAIRERLGLAQEIHAAGLDEMSLNVLACPLQAIRNVFDLMPTDTEAGRVTFAARMGKVPVALDRYVESLRAAAARGLVSPKRQVDACAAQCAQLAAEDGYFSNLLTASLVKNGDAADVALGDAVGAGRHPMRAAVAQARSAYTRMSAYLRGELRPQAPTADACCRARYQLLSRSCLGATVDLEETYQWGQQELARITAEMATVA